MIAQTTQASISGIVVNNEKKPQLGATVLVRNESTGFSTKALTNAQGEFTFKELPLGGPYTDAENVRFNYRVNTAGIINPSGDPFQLQVGVRNNF